MLRWICDKTHKNTIRNERILGFPGASHVNDKTRETHAMVWSCYDEITYIASKEMSRYVG